MLKWYCPVVTQGECTLTLRGFMERKSHSYNWLNLCINSIFFDILFRALEKQLRIILSFTYFIKSFCILNPTLLSTLKKSDIETGLSPSPVFITYFFFLVSDKILAKWLNREKHLHMFCSNVFAIDHLSYGWDHPRQSLPFLLFHDACAIE